MKLSIQKVTLLVYLLFAYIAAYPNIDPEDKFELRQIESVPQSEINAIYEDQRGFIWIATLDGLFRYDGHNFKSYQEGTSPNSISSNMIFAINEDSAGNIWIGTYGRGLCKIDPKTDAVTNYPLDELSSKEVSSNDIISIEIDSQDNIWIGSWHGVIKATLDKESYTIQSTTHYPIDKQQLANNDFINKIHQDKLGNIWICSSKTLRRVVEESPDSLEFDTYNISSHDITNFDDRSIMVVSDNVTILSREENSQRYTKKIIQNLEDGANRVVKNSDRSIWIGGRKGVSLLNLCPDGRWIINKHYNNQNLPFNIPTNVISALTITHDNQLWIGTRGGGILTITRKQKPFNNYHKPNNNSSGINAIIKSIYEDLDGNLWVGTEENGLLFQPKGNKYNHNIKSISVNKLDDRAYAFEQMPNNIVWVGTCYTTCLKAYDNRTLRQIPINFDVASLGFIFALKSSDHNTLWAGTYNNGLWRLTINDKGEIAHATNFNVGNSSICSNIVRSLSITANGDLWIATDMGICRIIPSELQSDNPTFLTSLKDDSKLELKDNYILQIVETKQGEILLGTMGRGLIHYYPEQDSLKHITTDNGLRNNSVKSIVENHEDGSIWLSTNRGLSKYTPSSGEIVNYGSDDGLDECEFSEICGIRRTNGDFVFGNREGVVVFRPDQITASSITPDLYFTDLYINHKRVGVGDLYNNRPILHNDLSFTKSIELNYDQRNFSIGFVGLNFFAPQGNKYIYKLEGMDREWIELRGEDMMAVYTNIIEGKYTFRVKAANGDGVWSDHELKLDIVVNPPLYRSTIAHIIYVLLALLILYAIYWVISLVMSKRREVFMAQMEQHKAEDLVQHKLEFFMNISHEFRTPLTLINIPLERLIANSANYSDKLLTEGLSEIKHNVNMLLSLINQLLDFRKIERGKQNIDPRATDIVAFLDNYFNYFKPLAQKNNITYSYNHEQSPILVDIDHKLFEKVIINILANAFKYTTAGGTIEMSVSSDTLNSGVTISVKDNGRGVAKDEIPYLFDRFYQGENRTYTSNGSAGSGIGLSLCKSIVELHMGSIWAQSDINQGFECTIQMQPSTSSTPEYRIPTKESEPVASVNVVNDMLYETEHITSTKRKRDKRELILIVEDNEHLRLELSRELDDDYDIVMASNGKEGLELCRESKPTLIITDVMMPIMNGIEMCRQIKSCEEVSHTPIMVLSADSSIRNQIDSFTIGGADGYLDKPFSVEVLRCKIEAILNNREILKKRFNQVAIVNPEEIAKTPADLKYLSQIIDIIKKNMSNSELSIEHIAQEYGVSRTYLNRKIKALTGQTSTQLLRNIRLKYAAKLILQKSMNITEVAWAVGYNDVNTFRVRFKETFGVSPTNYKGESVIKDCESICDDLEF